MGLVTGTIPLKETQDKFISFLKDQKKALATILAYKSDIAQLVGFLEEKGISVPNAATQELLEEFKTKLAKEGYEAKSISRKINSIKTFFRYLKAEGDVENDPSLLLTHPQFELKPPRVLSKLEYRALRDACRQDIRLSAIVELMLQTGIRIGELANLTTDDVKENEIFIKAFESHQSRSIPINRAAKEALRRYLEQRLKVKEKKVFITKTGRPFLIRNIRSAIERYFELAGIKNAKVNDLRHTWIYYHLAAGTPLVTISRFAGHKRLATTEKYLKLIGEKTSNNIKLEEL